jgi:hypothetical protein
VGFGVAAAVDAAVVAGAGCYCSLHSSRTTIRDCLAAVGQSGRR